MDPITSENQDQALQQPEKISEGIYKIKEEMPCAPNEISLNSTTASGAFGNFNAEQLGMIFVALAQKNNDWVGISDGLLSETIFKGKQVHDQAKNPNSIQKQEIPLSPMFFSSIVDNVRSGRDFLINNNYLKVNQETSVGGITENVFSPTSLMVEKMKNQQDLVQKFAPKPVETPVKV